MTAPFVPSTAPQQPTALDEATVGRDLADAKAVDNAERRLRQHIEADDDTVDIECQFLRAGVDRLRYQARQLGWRDRATEAVDRMTLQP
jgi:hypothetical protein